MTKTDVSALVTLIRRYWTLERIELWHEYEKTDKSIPWREYERMNSKEAET
ncbi:MAG: hypothetical protein IKG98_11490 [Ruminococcus sp.]|nr:hypothetical protein [Ruminococcus sp.]